MSFICVSRFHHSVQGRQTMMMMMMFAFITYSVSCKHYGKCCDRGDEALSNQLKEILRGYFESESTESNKEDVAWEWITPDARQVGSVCLLLCFF